jgi:AraC-like DNA-binding protein
VLGCADHAIVAPAARLDEPLPQSDPDAASVVEQQCRELLDRRRRAGPVSGRVRAALLTHPADMNDMQRIARELAVEERTLRWHLSMEGTTFRAPVDEVRETLATELLATARLTIQETADRLGYHDAASFSRAYKRWTGKRPGDVGRAFQ